MGFHLWVSSSVGSLMDCLERLNTVWTRCQHWGLVSLKNGPFVLSSWPFTYYFLVLIFFIQAMTCISSLVILIQYLSDADTCVSRFTWKQSSVPVLAKRGLLLLSTSTITLNAFLPQLLPSMLQLSREPSRDTTSLSPAIPSDNFQVGICFIVSRKNFRFEQNGMIQNLTYCWIIILKTYGYALNPLPVCKSWEFYLNLCQAHCTWTSRF